MGKNQYKWAFFLVMGLVAVVGLMAGLKYLGIKLPAIGGAQQTIIEQTQVAASQSDAFCPTTKQTAVTITVKNLEDDTKDDTFDVSGYLFAVDSAGKENYMTTVTDTTAGAVSIGSNSPTCLQKYRLRFVSADANEGDNAKIDRVISGAGAVLIDGGKAVEFTPSGANYVLLLGGERHGVLNFKMWDNVLAGWMCNSDDTCTDYEADGVTFESTTNGSAMAIGATSDFNVKLYFKSSQSNTSFDDFGMLLLVEEGTDVPTIWQDPSTVKVNGVPYTETILVGEEAKQFSSYDFTYALDSIDVTDSENILEWAQKPNSGQDPSTDVQFDFASKGAYLSVDGSTIKYGGAKDDTSYTVVYTIQDVTVNIS